MADIAFEDEKISYDQLVEKRGATEKSSDIPLGSLPVLTLEDGRVVTQSMAIARYAAKLANLYPEDPLEALFVDEVLDTVQDMTVDIPRNPDPETLKQLREEYAAGKLKIYLSYLAEKLDSSGPYLLGARLTVADICLYVALKHFRKGILDHFATDYDAHWPIFQTFIEAMEGNADFAPYKI